MGYADARRARRGDLRGQLETGRAPLRRPVREQHRSGRRPAPWCSPAPRTIRTTLATLAEMGFARPQRGRGAHPRLAPRPHPRHPRRPGARAADRADAASCCARWPHQAEPDAAFARFDEFVSNLPAGVQLFSLFRANPRLLGLVADLMGIAPRLAGHLSRRRQPARRHAGARFLRAAAGRRDAGGRARPAARRAADDLQDALDVGRAAGPTAASSRSACTSCSG